MYKYVFYEYNINIIVLTKKYNLILLCYRRAILSGLHASVERKFNRIIKYDALCGKLSFMDSFFDLKYFMVKTI